MPRRFRLTSPKPLHESDVVRACCDLLRLRGWYVERQQTGLFKTPDGRWISVGKRGIPDWYALHARHPGFLLEVKRPGEELSPDQKQRIFEIEIGYRIKVAVISDVADLDAWLNEHEKETVDLC